MNRREKEKMERLGLPNRNLRMVRLKQIMMRDLRRNFQGQTLNVNQIIFRFRGKLMRIKDTLYSPSENDVKLAIDELLYKGRLIPKRHVALMLNTILVPKRL